MSKKALDIQVSGMLNQGFHLETDVGWYGTNQRMGPAEREEMHRAEMIDAACEARRKKEKRNRNHGPMEA